MLKRILSAAVVSALLLPAPLAAGEDAPEETITAPNTDDCPQKLLPPPPVTTSERLAPGATSPTPLPATQSSNCGVLAPRGFSVDPDVVAAAWLVADIDTGEIIASKDPHGRYRPASIIKALLALVAIDELDPHRVIVATAADANMEGSAVGLGKGGKYTVTNLLQGLILASGNDASHALARALGGDEATLEKINALAQRLGTRDTYAASYSGLDAPGMSTSAYDMALIYQAAFRNPTFAKIANTGHVDFPGYGELGGFEVWNDNGLFANDPDSIGGKTGYTSDAHHTFVGALDRDGRRLMAVVLDTRVEGGSRSWQQAQKLLHEAYTVPPGAGVGQLRNHTPTVTTTPAPRPTTPRPTTPPPTTPPPPEASPTSFALGWIVVTLVTAAAAVVATLWLRGARKSSRRRARRHV